MERERVILAVDRGTSGPKVGLVSPAGHVLASEVEQMPLLLLPNQGAEQDPEAWWQAIRRATRRLLERELVAGALSGRPGRGGGLRPRPPGRKSQYGARIWNGGDNSSAGMVRELLKRYIDLLYKVA